MSNQLSLAEQLAPLKQAMCKVELHDADSCFLLSGQDAQHEEMDFFESKKTKGRLGRKRPERHSSNAEISHSSSKVLTPTELGRKNNKLRLKPKMATCPYCHCSLKPGNVKKHIARVHDKTPPGSLPDSRPIARKNKTKKKKRRPGYREQFRYGSSIYAPRREFPRTAEEKELQDRINRQGFHEGARVPGSNLRRVAK